jgi:putative PIN family toxin of toxin-antitoxin system
MYPESTPGRIVRTWREGRFDLVVSRYQLREIGRVLAYPKIRRILHWHQSMIERFLKQIYLRSILVETEDANAHVPRDPDDSPILASLLTGRAEYLVTGDNDLLALGEDHPILTPA